MKNTALIAVIVAAVLVSGGVVYAQIANGDWGQGMGYGSGPGWCLSETGGNTNVENRALRDELVTKQAELSNQYSKASPDSARISELRKEIVDIQTRLQQKAENNGISAYGCGQGRGARGPGMMYASGSFGCPRW
jgi:Spy/CpxP family protein refolding chaperone